MPLPILRASASDVSRLYCKTEVDWSRAIADEAPLDIGTAFTNAALADVPQANQILDAAIPANEPAERAVAGGLRHFELAGTACHAWLPNPAADDSALAAALNAQGFVASPIDVWRHSQEHSAVSAELADVLIIPARASFRHLQQLADDRGLSVQQAPAMLLHLDDPHLDAIIALRHGVAVCSAGILAAGEVGRLDFFYPHPTLCDDATARAVLERALEIGRRSLFRHLLAGTGSADVRTASLLASVGFNKVCQLTRYIRKRP